MRWLPQANEAVGNIEYHRIGPTPDDDVVQNNDQVARQHSLHAGLREEGSEPSLGRQGPLKNGACLLAAPHDDCDTRTKDRRVCHGQRAMPG